ncbi:MAG: hypothetical protein ACKVVT_06705 [Dehalococcoidia bacterium]
MPDLRAPPGLGGLFETAGLRHALIGGHGVNAWITPRETDDYDFVVWPDRAAIERVEAGLLAIGLKHVRRQDIGEASGPDFSMLANDSLQFKVDLQVAKTDYQIGIIERAIPVGDTGLSVATREDLVVLKLLAMRSQDQRDIALMVDLRGNELDWEYIEHWAAIWEVVPALRVFRPAPG